MRVAKALLSAISPTPLAYSTILAFYQTNGPKSKQFVGLDNFRFILTDPDFGVAQGYTTFAFESDRISALSGLRIKKLCAFAIPPLRLTNRADRFSSAPSLTRSGTSRQGGNRLTGYL